MSVAESDALHARVQAYMAETLEAQHADPAVADSAAFDSLACALARHQVRHIPAMARLFAARGVVADALKHAYEIPALVTDVFRHRRIAVHPPTMDTRQFLTSGTTQGGELRGCQPLRLVDTYQKGALAWGGALLFPDTRDLGFLGLVSPEKVAPESSLTFMLERFAEVLNGVSSFHWNGESLDLAGIVGRCRDAAKQNKPLLVAGTSFAFVHLCDAMVKAGTRLPLPQMSRVMQTGGFKGRSREVDAMTLSTSIANLFQIPQARIVGEYGMTELSSQLYQRHIVAEADDDAAAANARYYPPPWLRVVAVDPATLAPRPPGNEGIARFVDLANVDSAVAIQTADRVRVNEDGAVLLLGRQPGAPPRGCSLSMEHVLGAGNE